MVGYSNVLAVLLVLGMLASAWPVWGGDVQGSGTGPVLEDDEWNPDAIPEGAGRFTENLGQWPSGVLFAADTPFGRVWLGEDGAMYDVRTGDGGHALRVNFGSVPPSRPQGVDPVGTRSSYFLGSDTSTWVSGARSYREVLYEHVWEGIAVRYYFSGEDLKYDVIVGPDGDPSDIRFELDGHRSLEVSRDGLDITLSEGLVLHDRDLIAYYDDGGVAKASFDPSPDSYGFSVAKTPGRALVIDPVVVQSSTLLGGTYSETAFDTEVDENGNIFLAGTSSSTDLPVTPGAYKVEQDYVDIFVAKMSYNASELLWCTLVGGTSQEFLSGLEIDGDGYVYVAGTSWSSDYPVTEDAFQKDHNQGSQIMRNDFIVTKLEPDGSDLVYSTYVGGYGPESGGQLRVRDGRAAVVGWTDSKDFPTNEGFFAAFHGDGILFIMSANGSEMENFHFWGGSSSEGAYCLDWADDGNIVVGGYTSSPDFWTTPGVFQEERVSFMSGFVSKYSPKDDTVLWSTYCGGASEAIYVIECDEDGYVYLGGHSFYSGPGSTYPVTEGAYDTEYNGDTEGFVSKMDPNGTRMEFSTLLGGDGRDRVYDIEVLDNRSVVAVGSMESGGNYSVTGGCLDDVWDGESEGYLMMLSSDGTRAEYSTYVGGNNADEVQNVEVTPWDNLVLTGTTFSKDFTVTEGAYQPVLAGYGDVFLTTIGEPAPPGAPRDLAATGRDGSIDLTWRSPLGDGGYPVQKYLVFRGTAMDRLHLHQVLDDETHLRDMEVEYGVRYYYAVQADNFKGRGPLSNIAGNLSFTFPDSPVNLTGSAGMDGIHLQWEDPEFTGGLGITGYRIYRGAPGGIPELIYTTVPGDTEYVDISVVDRTTYQYQVATLNAYGGSRVRASVILRALGPPSAPLELDHSYGDLFVRLRWQPPQEDYGRDVEGYNVYRTTLDGPSEQVGTVTTRWFLDEDVEVGVLYYYRVVAFNAKGEGELSSEIEVRVTVRPWPPEAVEATAQRDFVRVTWSPPAFDGATPVLEYRVYQGRSCVGVVSASAQLIFLHDVPYDGLSREYHVTAVNAEGESAPSGIAATRAFQVPGVPTALGIEWDVGSITVEWANPASDGGTPLISFILYRRVVPTNGWVLFSTLPPDALLYTDGTVVNGVEYQYRVTATNLVGEGEPSAEVSAVPVGPPEPPIGVSATGYSGSARVTWDAPPSTGGIPLDGYRVYRVEEDGGVELHTTVTPDTLALYVTGLTNGGSYLFAVAAYHEYWTSVLSDVVEARPTGPPGGPASLMALWVEDHVYISWSAPGDDGGSPVTGYRLRRDDWDGGRWHDLDVLNTSYVDTDVERGSTYNYTVLAVNSVDDGPEARTQFTVPEEPEEPPKPAEPDDRPLLVLGVAIVVAVAVAAYGARRNRGGEGR